MNKTLPATGTLYTVAAPSGTGKTTLVKALVDKITHLTVSISHTTRAKRPTEQHGVNYYYVTEAEFQRMVEHGDFLEHATVFDHFYGTSRHWVEETLSCGLDVILEIDWQGCQQVKHLFPNSIGIFILPPSLTELSQRLFSRNQDKPEIIKQRLADVREAVSHISDFDYIVMNDDFDAAVNDLETIIQAGRLSQRRQRLRFGKLLNDLAKIKEK